MKKTSPPHLVWPWARVKPTGKGMFFHIWQWQQAEGKSAENAHHFLRAVPSSGASAISAESIPFQPSVQHPDDPNPPPIPGRHFLWIFGSASIKIDSALPGDYGAVAVADKGKEDKGWRQFGSLNA